MRSLPPPARCGRGSSADNMDIRLQDQAAALLLAFVLGAALGFFYDLLRPVRRASPHSLSLCFDALFCLVSGYAAFCFAMAAGDGRLGTWELCSAALGFALYMHTLSALILRVTKKMWRAAGRALAWSKKNIKKTAFSAKLVFKNFVECFIIKK